MPHAESGSALRHSIGEKFHCNRAVELGIEASISHSHASGADGGLDAVDTESRTRANGAPSATVTPDFRSSSEPSARSRDSTVCRNSSSPWHASDKKASLSLAGCSRTERIEHRSVASLGTHGGGAYDCICDPVADALHRSEAREPDRPASHTASS